MLQRARRSCLLDRDAGHGAHRNGHRNIGGGPGRGAVECAHLAHHAQAERRRRHRRFACRRRDRKSTRLNSSHVEISYAVFCLKKKKKQNVNTKKQKKKKKKINKQKKQKLT